MNMCDLSNFYNKIIWFMLIDNILLCMSHVLCSVSVHFKEQKDHCSSLIQITDNYNSRPSANIPHKLEMGD